jgi:hypothetical protein
VAARNIKGVDCSTQNLEEFNCSVVQSTRVTQREIELQYLVSPALGAELRRGHTPVLISTHYFQKDSATILKVLGRNGLLENIDDITRYTTARLRQKVFSSGACEYLLEYKGPKERSSLGRLARHESSLTIDQELFLQLLPDASGGTVEKLRYCIPGWIFRPNSKDIPITLELDHVLKAGATPRSLPFEMYRADIEVSCLSLVTDIRSGSTSFSSLCSEAIEISAIDRKKVKQLSYSHLAAEGPTASLREAYESLLARRGSEAKRLRGKNT